jgi:hypothetical protein
MQKESISMLTKAMRYKSRCQISNSDCHRFNAGGADHEPGGYGLRPCLVKLGRFFFTRFIPQQSSIRSRLVPLTSRSNRRVEGISMLLFLKPSMTPSIACLTEERKKHCSIENVSCLTAGSRKEMMTSHLERLPIGPQSQV